MPSKEGAPCVTAAVPSAQKGTYSGLPPGADALLGGSVENFMNPVLESGSNCVALFVSTSSVSNVAMSSVPSGLLVPQSKSPSQMVTSLTTGPSTCAKNFQS